MSLFSEKIQKANGPAENANVSFLEDVIYGLSQDQKTIPPKYFYDAEGSKLFDQICELDTYYPTRTEMRILKENTNCIADIIDGHHLIEFGSGSSMKSRILLDAAKNLVSYIPVDISKEHLFSCADEVAKEYPKVNVIPICADFTKKFDLPSKLINCNRFGFFPGSTIGNFSPEQAKKFLSMTAKLLGSGGGLLIGVDLKKDPHTLNAAYNDKEGITAKFNLNLLKRINRELRGNFMLDDFCHEAYFNQEKSRIEMHLLSEKDQSVSINGHIFHFSTGESIHTENSYKYSIDEFYKLGKICGYKAQQTWTDNQQMFSVHYLSVAK